MSSVVQTAYQLSAGAGNVTLSWYKYVDALTPLLVLLVRHAQPGEDQVMPRGESPAKLLVRRLTVVLTVIVKTVVRNHAERGAEFRQRVHFRIITSVLVMLNASMNVAGAEESEEIKVPSGLCFWFFSLPNSICLASGPSSADCDCVRRRIGAFVPTARARLCLCLG